jgi:exodeoxyribonuclease VII large subunit
MKQDTIFSVKDITRYIKMKLEGDALLQDVWVRGEISNFTRHSSGHLYFTLKDADGRIKCVMFAKSSQRLVFMPRDGTKVLARGAVSVYDRDGQYQFYVSQMQPDGIGSLYLAYEQLKQKLEAEGLFEKARKRPLPPYPTAVGVITSPTGAAVRDILTTLRRRYPAASVLLYPVLVQGTQAAASIVRAIEAMNRLGEADVLIVGRGGGSIEELWAFNEEIVARSIHSSAIPVISAVGHETDFTIADFVADVRAATPTAAAELAVPYHLELRQQLHRIDQRLRQGLQYQMHQKRERLRIAAGAKVLVHPLNFLQQPAERLDRLREQLTFRAERIAGRSRDRWTRLIQALSRHNPQEKVALARSKNEALVHRLTQSVQVLAKAKRNEWLASVRQLDSLSPLKIMQRGYSLVYDEKGKNLINRLNQVQIGDVLKIRLTDGQVDCHVWSMEERDYVEGNGGTEI